MNSADSLIGPRLEIPSATIDRPLLIRGGKALALASFESRILYIAVCCLDVSMYIVIRTLYFPAYLHACVTGGEYNFSMRYIAIFFNTRILFNIRTAYFGAD